MCDHDECSYCDNELHTQREHTLQMCEECILIGERQADAIQSRECQICGRKGQGYVCYECRKYEVTETD